VTYFVRRILLWASVVRALVVVWHQNHQQMDVVWHKEFCNRRLGVRGVLNCLGHKFRQAPLVSSEAFFDNDFQGVGGIWGDHILGHRGGRTRGQGRGRGATTTKPTKWKNFVPDEERQLARSVLAILQDPIVGNQQKNSALWERIYEYYESFNPVVHRGAWFLESKWGVIKHDSIITMNSNIRMAKELYRTKNTKNGEFTYEHLLVNC